MNIFSIVNQIMNKETVLPAIQRDFVWEESKIEKLMDSIMRGYPIGIVLMWETYENIQFRYFDSDYLAGNRPTFQNNDEKLRLRIVLDGQQRLQSLYLALYGKYNGKNLYFDLLSGLDNDDSSDEKYHFYFLSEEEATTWNSKSQDINEGKTAEGFDEDKLIYVMNVKELFSRSSTEKIQLRKQISKSLSLSENSEERLETNISRFDESFSKDENILKSSIVDENIASTSPARKSESDVLEIFVRINRQGTPLSRSDLIFSMLKLNWKDSSSAIPEFVDSINRGNSFNFDIDFLIRCLFSVSDLGAKYDLDLLRKQKNLKLIKSNFSKCCDSIRALVDFVQNDCWCSSSKIIGGHNTLVPFVYYLFHLPKHNIPNSEIDSVRKSLFLFAFSKSFSRYADSRIKKFIEQALKPLILKQDYSFPYSQAINWIKYWERINGINEDLLQKNPLLAMNLVQNRSGASAHLSSNSSELDHIFPKSELRKKHLDETKVNHFANLWLLSKGKNQNKYNQHPKKYFDDVSKNTLKIAFIDSTLFDYRKYYAFLDARSNKIIEFIKKKIGYDDLDFDDE